MVRTLTLSGLFLMTINIVSSSTADTLAQRLGHPANAKLVILHADDLGMCHAANQAFFELHEFGIVRCGSVMVPCPWFPEMAAWAREHRDHDLGLHLTLTSEWKYYRWRPVTPADQVPGLVDEEGFMWRDERDVVAHATPAEVEKEIRAQIALARRFGLEPTHLDSHMGTLFSSSAFFQVYIRVAREENIPPMIPRVPKAVLEQYGLKAFSYERLEQAGYTILDGINLGVQGDDVVARFRAYEEALQALPSGVSEIILHPAAEGPELSHIAGSHRARDLDRQVFLLPSMRALLQRLGIQSIGYRDLWPLWEAGAGRAR